MTVTVKHPFVSTVADSADTSLVRPSNWNADHTIVGLGTAAELDAGTANGVATLDASGKVPVSELPAAVLGALSYQGAWNASTNTPTLTSSTGTKGYYYVVSVAGSTNLDGITDWLVGDWAVYNGTVWQKIDNTETVTSVNGQVGVVVLTTTNIAEGTNEYYTDARARAALSAGTGISYNSTTGVITNSSPSLGGDVVGPASATDNAIARFDTTTGKLIQNGLVTIDDAGNEANINAITFDTTPTTPPTAEGTLYWDSADGNQTLSLVMAGGTAVQQIGEEQYYRIKASSAITNGQVVMFTGSVGASGALQGAPATGLTASTASYVMGIATQDIALNGWGYVTSFGLVRGLDTSAFADGDILYYDPTTAGGLTKTIPSAPNAKVQVCAVTHAASNGSYFVRPSFGGALGQYEGDVQVTSPANGQLLVRDQTAGKWVNAALTAGTAISVTDAAGSVTIANTAPDQTVVLTAGTGISTSGTYPNFTITNTSPSSGGTVTSVTGTAPIASTGGNTPAISISQATTSTDGYLSSTDWNTFNNKQPSGSYLTTVTADSPLTGSGTSGSHLSIPAASGSVNGYLTSTDWTTFNSKAAAFTYTSTYIPYGQGTTTPNQSSTFTYDGTTVTAPVQRASNGIVCNSRTVSASFSIPSGDSAMSAGPITIASGVTVTVPSGGKWVVL